MLALNSLSRRMTRSARRDLKPGGSPLLVAPPDPQSDRWVSYGSGSVGDAVEGQLSGSWADGGVGGVDLGGVDHGLVLVSVCGGSGCESKDGGDGVLHLDGLFGISYLKSN